MHRRHAVLVWRGVLFTIAVLAALNWIGQLFMTPNQRLVDLVADLAHQQALSTIVASALIAVAVLMAAVLVPLMTMYTLYRLERQLPPVQPQQYLTVVRPRGALPPDVPGDAASNPDVLGTSAPTKPCLQAHPSTPPTPPCCRAGCVCGRPSSPAACAALTEAVMTHEAGLLLVNEVAPLIRGAVPRVVRPVGCEDAEELVQDALCSAAQMIEASELNGKKLYPSSIAFYAIQRARVGRRSGYAGEADVMSSAARLRSKVSIEDLEATVGDEDAEGITLHDALADQHAEDPAMVAARELDWAELMEEMNARDVAILKMAAGQLTNTELSLRWGVSCARVSQLKAELGRQVKLRWGDGALADAVAEPSWLRGSVRAARERSACRHARQA